MAKIIFKRFKEPQVLITFDEYTQLIDRFGTSKTKSITFRVKLPQIKGEF